LGVGHEADNLILENDNVEKPKESCWSDYREGPCKQRKDMNLVRWNILSLNKSDLRNMGVERWRSRALDRTEWASIMREANAKRKGL
jgi:hypothetical protein